MKKFLLPVLAVLSCCSSPEKIKTDENHRFSAYTDHFIEDLWMLNPGWASSVGYHKYDSVLTIPDQVHFENELAFVHANLDSIRSFTYDSLSASNKTDYRLLENYFRETEWSINTLRKYEWDPTVYNVCEGFAEMLGNNYDTLDSRLRSFYRRMAYVPDFYVAARKNIRNPTAEHTSLAVSQNLGGIAVFGEELENALGRSGLSEEEKAGIRLRASDCTRAIEDFAGWLRDSIKDANRSFRLGKEVYTQKFDYDMQSGFSAEEINQKALERKKELHGKMYAVTKELWPKYFGKKPVPADSLIAIRTMIDKISLDHVQPDSFQTAIDRQIPELEKFVAEKQLLWIDPAKPLVVRKEPAYMAGFAGASISAPGPYDTTGNTYYNVGSMAGWDKERAESYLREYNKYILQILNIHEAIPGHYTQLVYSNRSPGIIKSVFRSGPMVEGWAVYTELMMLENGYGAAPGESHASPEMWLMYYKWNLRTVCNTILDYALHVNGLAKEQALDLLTREAFQQQAEAEGKWRRATLSQVQLCSYFTGFAEICALRDELKNNLGGHFSLKEFHENFLSYGSAPVRYIREMMLDEVRN